MCHTSVDIVLYYVFRDATEVLFNIHGLLSILSFRIFAVVNKYFSKPCFIRYSITLTCVLEKLFVD